MFFCLFEIVGLCLACDTRDGANTGWIQAIPLISCCFHYYGGLTHPTAASIWWPVQQQEQIALLDWSQPMVAANKLPLLSDPCLCGRCVAAAVRVFMWIRICLSVCVQIHVCMTQGDLFPIRKWNPLWGFFPPPSQRTIFFYYFTCTFLSHWVCSHTATPRQASAASILWTEVLSGYYFSADHIKTTAIKCYWAIWLCLLRGKKEVSSERRKAEK